MNKTTATQKEVEDLSKHIQANHPNLHAIVLQKNRTEITTIGEVKELSRVFNKCFPDLYILIIKRDTLSQIEFNTIIKELQTKINENINKSR